MKIPPRIRVCPIKHFYRLIPELSQTARAGAVLCTTDRIRWDLVGRIPCCHASFADVIDENRPDSFRTDIAQDILAFVQGLPEDADLYICCDYGESRSPAIAAALMHYFGREDEMAVWKNVAYHPNPFVYFLQSQACGLTEVTREDARELAEYNQMLFRRQVARSSAKG